jgi:hypothetical protein
MGAAVRDHRNAVRNQSESLSAINRNTCPQSPESARWLKTLRRRSQTAHLDWDRFVRITDAKVNAAAAVTVPDNVRNAQAPQVRVTSQKLADGVWFSDNALRRL